MHCFVVVVATIPLTLATCYFQIRWRNRFKGDIGNDALTGVDGTDFPFPASGRDFYSYKYKKSGLRYEVGVSIERGDLVWINGPHEPGIWPDISIFRNSMLSQLEEGERVVADRGYFGECPQYCKCPGHITSDEDTAAMEGAVRNRTETINKRFKQWGIMKQCFRKRSVDKHGKAFRAVAVMTQLAIENGEPLFQLEYVDPHLDDMHYFEDNAVFDACVTEEHDDANGRNDVECEEL